MNLAIRDSFLPLAEQECMKMEQVPCSVNHHFAPGIYIREVRIPAGTFAIGHHQKTTHLNVMLKGRVKMILENGSVEELVAPQTFVCGPGRKVGYILEDMVWQNIYATCETDVDKLEATYIDKSPSWSASQEQLMAAARLQHEADREDYHLMLAQVGIPHFVALQQSQNEDDQIGFPPGNWRIRVHDSPIQGKGIFATYPIEEGDLIAPARIEGKRTPAGRFTNHSKTPNARMLVDSDGNIVLVASRRIEGCRGGDSGEEVTIDYRQAIALVRGVPCLP